MVKWLNGLLFWRVLVLRTNHSTIQPSNHFLTFAHFFETVLCQCEILSGRKRTKYNQTMKEFILKTGILAAVLLMFAGHVNAQKFGYVNSALVLSEMPEMKQLQSSLEAFQKVKQKEGEAKMKAFEQKRAAAAQKKEAGSMAPVEEQQVMAELQKMQEELYQFSANAEKEVAEKQQKDMEPILTKVNDAINAVAKEGSFQYIFDAQSGVILYADESSDVTELVMAKLGIAMPTATPAGN